MPLSDIMVEYTTNSELIRTVFDSEEYQYKRTQLFLKYYIQDSEKTSFNIASVEELMNYPKNIFEIQQESIKNGNRAEIINIITQNLTGLSSEQFLQYRNMFLENHDIETLLENTEQYGDKLKNLTIVKELLNLVDTMDEKQLQEFATNISLRNYNELMQGDFSLVSMRESFRDFLSNIEQEYGKEINQSLGYSTKGIDTFEFNGQKVNIHDVNGQFTLLIHMTRNSTPNNNKHNQTCMSLISEGHYNVAAEEVGVKTDANIGFFIFDNVPPELLYGTANHNMDSNSRGRTYANFMTTDNTILNAEPADNTTTAMHTEQVYFYQGIDKEGKLIRIKPTALATFEKYPNEHTLQIAAQYGLDILRIPDMQTNLQGMLENGIVTPSLVKGYQGDSSQILDVLSRKSVLTSDEVLALQTLRRKEGSQEIQQQIDALLEKIPKTKGKEEILSLVDDMTMSDLRGISAETRKMYELINNPQIVQEKE